MNVGDVPAVLMVGVKMLLLGGAIFKSVQQCKK